METETLYKLYKPLLFAIAYRLLGGVTDAEDIVQDTFLVWAEQSGNTPVTNVKSYLCRIVSNLCADRIRQLARQRASYAGPWLPEPLVEDGGSPEDICLRKDTLNTAYLLLLQQLSETERIVFVLREAFAFRYEEIAAATGKSAAHCRQIFHRARRGMPRRTGTEPGVAAARTERARAIVGQFMQSFEQGDISRVMELLAADATLFTDGGGKAKSAPNPIVSPARVIAFFVGTSAKQPPDLSVRQTTVNGLPGFVFAFGGTVRYVLSFAFEDDRISRLYMVVNPEKLTHVRA